MKKLKRLSEKDMKTIIGGKYYGGGVSCNSKKCVVDWSKATSCIGQGWVASTIHQKIGSY